MSVADFTPAEAAEAIREFAASVGPKAEVYASLNTSRQYGTPARPCHITFYPKGLIGGGEQVSVDDASWREALGSLTEKWAERSDQHVFNTIRSMALRIIALTADHGECTDAALRAEFDASDVQRYGDQACAQATEMAGLGPFSIVTLRGANEAEAA